MNKDGIIAEKLINKDNIESINRNKYSQIYMFTTENIHGITQKISFQNKKVLTVCSSGDQVFNMLLCGAEEIDTFDINIFTKYFFYFKEASIRALNYQEFLNFFFPNSFAKKNQIFSLKTYTKIRNYIKDDYAKSFWDQIFSKYNGEKLYYSDLFTQDHYPKKTNQVCNNYLMNEQNYKTLQQKLAIYSFTFYHLNILKNSLASTKRYDYIYLSNILDYLPIKEELEYAKKVKEILLKLRKNMTDNGMIMVSYLYCYLDEYWLDNYNGKLKSSIFRKKHFEEDYDCIDFKGINSLKSKRQTDKDALLLYRKKYYKKNNDN